MITNEDVKLIFSIMNSSLELTYEETLLKNKLELLIKQINIQEEMNNKLCDIQDELKVIYEEENRLKEEK